MDKGTTEYLDASKASKGCVERGKPAIGVETFPDEAHTPLALASGRVDAALVDSGPAAWAARESHGKLQVAGELPGAISRVTINGGR